MKNCNVISSRNRRYNRYFLRDVLMFFLILAIIFVLGGDKEAISAQVDDPQIVVQNGEKVLLLPDSLLDSIKDRFPTLHVPTQFDMTGEWLVEQKLNPFPFIAWGDFNGNGLIDVALILVRKEGEKQKKHHKPEHFANPWQFVIFKKLQDGRYKPAREISKKQWVAFIFDQEQDDDYKKVQEEKYVENILLPQQIILRTVKKGTDWAPESGDVPTEYKHDFDAIEVEINIKKNNIDQIFQTLIYWERNKYLMYLP